MSSGVCVWVCVCEREIKKSEDGNQDPSGFKSQPNLFIYFYSEVWATHFPFSLHLRSLMLVFNRGLSQTLSKQLYLGGNLQAKCLVFGGFAGRFSCNPKSTCNGWIAVGERANTLSTTNVLRNSLPGVLWGIAIVRRVHTHTQGWLRREGGASQMQTKK